MAFHGFSSVSEECGTPDCRVFLEPPSPAFWALLNAKGHFDQGYPSKATLPPISQKKTELANK
jgi:hypothetical protein